MKSSKSASRYAQALLDLAIEQNKVDAIAADMKYMATVCAENRDLELMLESPVVKADKKIAVLNAVFDQFDKATASFVELIVKNGREAYLPQIAESFDAILKQYLGIIPVTLISAHRLDDKVKKEIVSKVQNFTSGTVELTEKIDADLIGGFIVRMGDDQIDASVASQMNKLKQRLTR
ncbi:ATP synthase F1 subunit delta [Fluviicola sp.]|jgi:F-type H+-transporting ATPase subunit delta|uniref:ATP synthase F1 subunit delta n=1 Tax=Fluviicola sp. TaxID=1917219 RepID=UPI0028388CDC|nr:ATP synthase F1 subunit delta [Fluviicola sp.]MDR0803371.1 ATP synthase F1 subunit delta [Fluviicola sp.]